MSDSAALMLHQLSSAGTGFFRIPSFMCLLGSRAHGRRIWKGRCSSRPALPALRVSAAPGAAAAHEPTAGPPLPPFAWELHATAWDAETLKGWFKGPRALRSPAPQSEASAGGSEPL